MKSAVKYLMTGFLFFTAPLWADDFQKDLSNTLAGASQTLMTKQKDGRYWAMPLYLGPMYSSQYYLIRHWLEFKSLSKKRTWESLLEEAKLKESIFSSQNQQDGSWEILHDPNHPEGNLNATIMNYAALKAMGQDPKSPNLRLAREFILRQGGIENSSLFTKIILALFNNYPWSKIPSIPYLVFNSHSPWTTADFGEWIGPHLYPMAYLRKIEARRNLGPDYNWQELALEPMVLPDQVDFLQKPESEDDKEQLIKIAKAQRPFGSYAYTSATLFAVMALATHIGELPTEPPSPFEEQIQKGLHYVEEQYFHSDESSYLGNTCDGRYWDTALIGQALLESRSFPANHLRPVKDFLYSIRDQKTGGYGFGKDFEQDMDTDDTAEIVLFFKKLREQDPEIDLFPLTYQPLQWLKSMQNSDHGWGAFAKDNTGNFILNFLTKDFQDSADLFDESSADVTGHVLEAFGHFGYNVNNYRFLQDAVDYLRKTQEKVIPEIRGAWLGRWAVNYIYGTVASVIGLNAVGVPLTDPMMKAASAWLTLCQNLEDGGFGESFYSYTDPKFACHGQSTVSQTAWALMGLIATGQGQSPTARRAAQFLVSQYKEQGGQFQDPYFVGTGHPKIVPMHYPAYAWAFSLMALSRYREAQVPH